MRTSIMEETIGEHKDKTGQFCSGRLVFSLENDISVFLVDTNTYQIIKAFDFAPEGNMQENTVEIGGKIQSLEWTDAILLVQTVNNAVLNVLQN